jgi:hypothetical protein
MRMLYSNFSDKNQCIGSTNSSDSVGAASGYANRCKGEVN